MSVEVGVEAVAIGEEATDRDLAAAGGGAEVLHLQAVLVEDQRAVHVGKAVGNAVISGVDVLELHLAGERGLPICPPARRRSHLAAGQDIGIEGMREGRADAAGRAQGKPSALGIGDAEDLRVPPARRSVSCPVDMELLECRDAVAEAHLERIGGLERDALGVDIEVVEGGVAVESDRRLQRTIEVTTPSIEELALMVPGANRSRACRHRSQRG